MHKFKPFQPFCADWAINLTPKRNEEDKSNKSSLFQVEYMHLQYIQNGSKSNAYVLNLDLKAL
jgi:hypothetical protein